MLRTVFVLVVSGRDRRSRTCSSLGTKTPNNAANLPGLLFGPPLHIVVKVLDLDQPIPQNVRGVVLVVIRRDPVNGIGEGEFHRRAEHSQ